MLDALPFARFDPASTRVAYVSIEALKLAFADREAYFADPRFATVPLNTLLAPADIAPRRALIDRARATMRIEPGDPWNGFAEQVGRPDSARIGSRNGEAHACASSAQ